MVTWVHSSHRDLSSILPLLTILAMWSWPADLISLHLSFLTCKMGYPDMIMCMGSSYGVRHTTSKQYMVTATICHISGFDPDLHVKITCSTFKTWLNRSGVMLLGRYFLKVAPVIDNCSTSSSTICLRAPAPASPRISEAQIPALPPATRNEKFWEWLQKFRF